MSEKILDTEYRTHIQHLRSKTQYDINNPIGEQQSYSGNTQYYDNGLYAKLPTVEDLVYGEIALNIAPGTETIAIKNSNGDIVFLPFNVAKKLQNLKETVDNNYNVLNQKIEEEIHVLSGNTISTYKDIESLLTALSGETKEELSQLKGGLNELSGYTHEQIDDIHDKIDGLSGYTQNSIDGINERLDGHDGILSGLTEQIEEISQNVVEGTNERLEELSGYTVSGFTQNAKDHEAIRKDLSDKIDGGIESLSGELTTQIEETTSQLQEAIDGVNSDVELLETYTEEQVERIDERIDDIESDLEDFTDETSSTIKKMNQSLGFISGGTFVPMSENLQDFNVTQSLDYIEGKLEKEIISGTTRYNDLLRIILEDEKVTANFAATINDSCGFTIHAKYAPQTEILKGLDVTMAIDTLYNVLTDRISGVTEEMKSEILEIIQDILDGLKNDLIDEMFERDSILLELIKKIKEELKSRFETVITYDALVELYLVGNLCPGMLYRITNYQATVNTDEPNASNASTAEDVNHISPYKNNGFDILVRATSDKTLSENAWAMYYPNDDDYTPNANYPQSWEIKYSIINDVDRFSWALDNGHGVIYYMKDNNGNEAPFDFKNIKVNNKFLFTDEGGNEASNSGRYKNNIIRPCYCEDGRVKLNGISFNAEEAIGNEFKVGCENITLEGIVSNNVISPSKNNTIISNKENTFIGFSVE